MKKSKNYKLPKYMEEERSIEQLKRRLKTKHISNSEKEALIDLIKRLDAEDEKLAETIEAQKETIYCFLLKC